MRLPSPLSAALVGLAPLLACVAAAMAAAQPPLVKPGAPGEDARALSAGESVALGLTPHTQADVHFMQDMIVHHAQAVEMVALIPERTETEAVRLMGTRISLTQETEIARMETWLTRRGHPVQSCLLIGQDADREDCAQSGMMHPPGHRMDGMAPGAAPMARMGDPGDQPLMHGMLSPRQMDALAAAEGGHFDRLFLEGMIQHHEGALYMVDMLVAQDGAGEEPDIAEFINAVVADQSAEIIRMQAILAALPPQGT